MKTIKTNKIFLSLSAIVSLATFYAHAQSKGVGPVQEVKIESLNIDLAKKGKEIFTAKCMSCHKLEERYVGPALKGLTKRRTPEWALNMMLNPAGMLEGDDTAKELLAEFMVQMPNQNLTQDDARSIYEYIRHYEEKGEIPASSKASPKSAHKAKK